MKELSAIEKLEAVKLIMETLGYEFDNMTVDESFSMFNAINDVVKPKPNKIECGECDGCGEIMWGGGDWMECSLCDGTGEIIAE